MPSYTTRRTMRFSPEQMYDLVADVERYPEFLPLCESLRVTSREEKDGLTVLIATMGVGYKSIRERFTTRVTLDEGNRKILVEYLDGPFRYLENRWQFLPKENGQCEVDFYITYEFRSRMLSMLMGVMFDKAFRKFASAFEARAAQVYGRSSVSLPTASRPMEA